MASGRRPKPTHLRLVDGTHRPARHGDREEARAAVKRHATAFGPLQMPKDLRGEAKKAWERWIAPADWLDGSRAPTAIAVCLLWQEYQEAPRQFPAAKHGVLRAFMSDLGLTDERRRGEPEKATDEFFDD